MQHRGLNRPPAAERPTRTSLRALVVAALLVMPATAPPAAAQLDDSCVVSALNRTAPVQPDGSWVLPNIPANFGQVRVRATCVDADGSVVRAGQSDFVTVPVNGVLRVPEIVFDAPEAVPATLALSAPVEVLTAVGEVVQLTATITFPDGSSRDVTAAAGTDYTSSNPALATLDGAGSLTAVASGRVLISAVNEGALGVLTLRLVLSGDSDGDGLPDDFEVANGLDPNNPADALSDPDEDALTVLEEFQAGLDPFDPDTDDDRLLDGEEVFEVGTDPLLFDTDGDLVSDGLEVLAGSNPLDGNSVNLPPILEALTVAPQAFVLTFNTVIGEASRLLRVTGTLIDGTELDITGAPYGTAYASSDLTIASFGIDPGRVFAGQNGTATVTASNGAFAATAEVAVQSFSPTALAFIRIPGFANGVAAGNGHAYVAAGARGFYAVDVSDPRTPFIAGSVETPGNANDVRVEGNFAYVADGPAGLRIIDVTSPASPLSVAAIDTPGVATDLAVAAGRAYVADGAAGVSIFDVSDPLVPTLLGTVDTPGNARGIDVSGDLAVVTDDRSGVHVLDVADPTAPFIAGSTHTRPNSVSRAADVAVRERLAYVADGSSTSLGGLRIIDFREPSTPVVVGTTSNRFGLTGVALEGDFALTADYFFANAVPIFNVATLFPFFNSTLNFARAPSFRDDNGNGIAADGGLVFLAGTRFTIRDNGTFGDSGLHIGRYLVLEDDEGIPPTVALTAPADGDAFLERSQVTVRAEAADDIQVAAVQFFLDGDLVHSDFTAPFEHRFRMPAGRPAVTLGARAVDLGDNEGFAEEITLQVIPDEAPTVELLSPIAGSRFTEGVTIPIAAAATDDVAVASVDLRVDGVSQATLTAPPFRFDYSIPLGITQFTVTAVAIDNVGQTSATDPLVIGVDDDLPPTASILTPVDGAEVVAGSRIQVLAGAGDDIAVTRVSLFVGGQLAGTDFTEPFEFEVTVPGAGELVLTAEATDTLAQTGISDEVRAVVIPDPLTTVFGRVLDPEGEPVPDVEVQALGLSSTSDADGLFFIDGVPTVQGNIFVAASVIVAGERLTGRSAATPPVPAGITDVGDIALREGAVVGYYDLNRNRGNATQVQPITTAGFEAVDVGDLRTADLSQFDILFVQNPSNSGYSSIYRGQLDKIFAWIEAGGVLVFHDRHVSTATSILPGEPGTIFRSLGGDIDVVDGTTRVTDGPGGLIDDSSLDGGNFSFHGVALANTIPLDGQGILSSANPNNLVLFSYSFGSGRVLYSTIPLDFYLAGSGPSGVSSRFRNVYAPNVLAHANDLR